jgi:hypothetical protein
MKKVILIYICLVQILILLNGQNDNKGTRSVIYFYRLPNFVGSAIQMKILINEAPVVKLRNGSMYKFELTPGEYYVSCKMADMARIKLIAEPGKTYYIKCYINNGFWSGIPVIELTDSTSGKSVIDGAALSQQVYEPVSMARPRSRLGLFMGGGGGFEKINMGYTDNQDVLTLSTGGGFAIGAEYGKEINRSFDLSVNWFYQGSTLSQNVKNGDASFNRMGLIVTPALIIPIKGGDYLRFKLGGGLGYYGFGSMAVNGSNAGGDNFILKYDPAFGVHASLIFESYFSDKGSFTMGLKYYNINYIYTSKGSTGVSSDPKVNKPDGSGIDFVFGYYYHF